MSPDWKAARMEAGRGRWAAFHASGYWHIPGQYGKRAADALARRLNESATPPTDLWALAAEQLLATMETQAAARFAGYGKAPVAYQTDAGQVEVTLGRGRQGALQVRLTMGGAKVTRGAAVAAIARRMEARLW